MERTNLLLVRIRINMSLSDRLALIVRANI
jgi:hypothetical protein